VSRVVSLVHLTSVEVEVVRRFMTVGGHGRLRRRRVAADGC
jgi:hypothetical protein